MRRVTFFEMTGMPEGEESRNKAAWDSVRMQNIHVQDSQSGRYFLVQFTKLEARGCESIRRLDPESEGLLKRVEEANDV